MTVHYVADADVSATLDRRLRALLSTCFTKPEDRVFRERRYFGTPPAHRWYIEPEDGSGELAAHLALHERTLLAGDQQFRCGGVSEVAVHPQSRGRGYVKLLLSAAHRWMKARNFQFSVLFGDPAIYSSSGYVPAPNIIRYRRADSGEPQEERFGEHAGSAAFMYLPLKGDRWPSNQVVVDINGVYF